MSPFHNRSVFPIARSRCCSTSSKSRYAAGSQRNEMAKGSAFRHYCVPHVCKEWFEVFVLGRFLYKTQLFCKSFVTNWIICCPFVFLFSDLPLFGPSFHSDCTIYYMTASSTISTTRESHSIANEELFLDSLLIT